MAGARDAGRLGRLTVVIWVVGYLFMGGPR